MDTWKPITVTVEVAVKLSSLGRTLLYELMNSGHIKSIKVGKRRLVNVASLEAFLTTQQGKE